MSTEEHEIAVTMRKAGQNDGAILLALSQQGLSPTDAEDVVRSLGGNAFQLAPGERVKPEWSETSAPASSQDGWLVFKGVVAAVGLVVLVASGASMSGHHGLAMIKAALFTGAGVVALFRLTAR